jgi:hypothetical protein
MSNTNSGLQKIMDAQVDNDWSALEDLPFEDPKWPHMKEVTDKIKKAIKDGGREKPLKKPPSIKDVICCLQWHFLRGTVGVLRYTFENGRVPAAWKLVCHRHDNSTLHACPIYMYMYICINIYIYTILTLL